MKIKELPIYKDTIVEIVDTRKLGYEEEATAYLGKVTEAPEELLQRNVSFFHPAMIDGRYGKIGKYKEEYRFTVIIKVFVD